MAKMTGARVKEHLLAMSEGDVLWVGSDLWLSLGETFEVEGRFGQKTILAADDLPREFLDNREYEVVR